MTSSQRRRARAVWLKNAILRHDHAGRHSRSALAGGQPALTVLPLAKHLRHAISIQRARGAPAKRLRYPCGRQRESMRTAPAYDGGLAIAEWRYECDITLFAPSGMVGLNTRGLSSQP